MTPSGLVAVAFSAASAARPIARTADPVAGRPAYRAKHQAPAAAATDAASADEVRSVYSSSQTISRQPAAAPSRSAA